MDNAENTVYVSSGDAMPFIVEMINSGKFVSLRIKGGSMLPFLVPDRDSVVLKKIDSSLKKGDIVLCRRASGEYVIHRISYIDKNGMLKIIGDGQLVEEYPVSPKSVLAIAASVCRKGKKLKHGNFLWELFKNDISRTFLKKIFLKNLYKRGKKKFD